ncbi:class I SAM-dependent methyltransferase [Streptomyces sp. NPDC055722]
MARIDYDGTVAGLYEAGRGAPAGGLEGWHRALKPYLPTALPTLDLGAGTGLYARLIHDWFAQQVIAVEPAISMLRQAPSGPGIRRVVGRAERIPLLDSSCGAAWLSTMIHHIDDLPAAAHELRRVLVPGVPVLIRSAFPGDQDRIALYRFFPTAGAIIDSFPSIAEVTAAFSAAGFACESVSRVSQVNAVSLAEFYAKARLRANTTLVGIPDDDFAAGLEALRLAAARSAEPAVSELTLVVLR